MTENIIPLCFNCAEKEVEAPYTNAAGEGFCSGSCEQEANEEFFKDSYDRLLARDQAPIVTISAAP